MHIAFITLGFSPYRASGLAISGERLVTGLLTRGHQVTVIAGGPRNLREPGRPSGLRVIRLPLGKSDWIGFGFRAARQVSRINHQENFDAIHFYDIYFAWAFFGNFIGTLHHSYAQRLATSRNVGPTKKVYYWLSLLLAERPAIHRAQGLLAVSATSMQEYIRVYNLSPANVTLARHGIDIEFFRRVPTHDNGLRAQLGILPEEPVLMYSGFFTARKGLEYLAQAIPLISPAPRLVLTGRWTEKFRERFYTLLGPARDQVIEAGFVPDEWMPAYFSMADVYVSSSLLEGFGLPIAEALACETPIVAANAGAIAEVTGPGGILVPPGDASALAEGVSNLLSNPAKRRELGQRGREHIVQNFSVDSMVTSHLEAYQKYSLSKRHS